MRGCPQESSDRSQDAMHRDHSCLLRICDGTDTCWRSTHTVRSPPQIGYINPVSAPEVFESALLWGIAIADTRASGFESAEVSVAWTQLSCSVAGRTVILNDDWGNVRGGLYRRFPWFGTDEHEPMPILRFSNATVPPKAFTTLRVGRRPETASGIFGTPLTGQTCRAARARGVRPKLWLKFRPGALLQIGMDYWRNATTPYGSGGNNHEAGVSNWYFPSDAWQEVMFSDIPPVAVAAPEIPSMR